jgi:hypothetical protein
MFGVRRGDDVVVCALGRTHTDYRSNQVRLDPRELQEDGLHFKSQGWHFCGCCDVHPRFEGATVKASDADRDCWRMSAYEIRAPYAGVILTPSSDEPERMESADADKLDRAAERQSRAGNDDLRLGRRVGCLTSRRSVAH